MRHFKRAMITGASSGIGRAFAEALPADTGLLLTGRDAGRLAEVATRVARDGRSVQTISVDLTCEADRDRLIACANSLAVDLLINNAGCGRLGAFLDNPPDAERQTVLLNVVAVVDLTRRLLPGMLQRAHADGRRAGLIVVSSTAAFAPVPFFATYGASKTFDLHLTEALAEELRGEPVDILALCPGATRTAFGVSAGHRGSVPGASNPRLVATAALAALGRERVHVSGRLSQAALQPVVLPRRLVSSAVGLAMRLVSGKKR